MPWTDGRVAALTPPMLPVSFVRLRRGGFGGWASPPAIEPIASRAGSGAVRCSVLARFFLEISLGVFSVSFHYTCDEEVARPHLSGYQSAVVCGDPGRAFLPSTPIDQMAVKQKRYLRDMSLSLDTSPPS